LFTTNLLFLLPNDLATSDFAYLLTNDLMSLEAMFIGVFSLFPSSWREVEWY
jgi:hypothetical protein